MEMLKSAIFLFAFATLLSLQKMTYSC